MGETEKDKLFEAKLQLVKQELLNEIYQKTESSTKAMEQEFAEKIQQIKNSTPASFEIPASLKWVIGILMTLFLTFISLVIGFNVTSSESIAKLRVDMASVQEKIKIHEEYKIHLNSRLKKLYQLNSLQYPKIEHKTNQ
jgi:hypothetical protein